MAKKGCGRYGCGNKLTFDRQRLGDGAASPAQQTIYLEDFDTGGDSDEYPIPSGDYKKFPVGWTLPGAPNYENQEMVCYGSGMFIDSSIIGGSGVKCALFLNSDGNQQYCTSKPFSTIGFTDIKLDLLLKQIQGDNGGPTDFPNIDIEWSDDNSNWSSITTITQSQYPNDSTWRAINTISLPVGVENKANVYIRFGFLSDTFGSITCIDDFKIKGTS